MNRSNFRPFANNRKKYARKKKQYPKSEAEMEVTCPIPPGQYNSKVKLFSSRCRIRKTNRTTAKISKYHILERDNMGPDICNKILDEDNGLRCDRKIKIDLKNVIPALSPILELFKNRHNRYNYFEKLKHTIAKNSKKYASQKLKNQIDVRLLQSFFGLLLYETVPFELFGTSRNRKAVKKTIYRLLKTVPERILITSATKRTVQQTHATRALLDMQPLLKKLDISKINWLHSIDNRTVQWIIILKLLHWFFTQYIIKILHKYVVLEAFKKQWVYITKDDWCHMQEEFIKERESTLSLVPWTTLNKSRCIGIYKFIPCHSGLRPLFITKYNTKETYDIDLVLRFLQQLYVTYFNKNGISTVASCKEVILNFTTKNQQIQLYYVRCDIQDAFGSIKQEKLYDIINACCNQLENYLAVQTFKLIKTKRNQSRIKKYTVQVLSQYLKKYVESLTSKYAPTKEKPKLVQRKILINKIYKLIFQQKVKMNGRVYSIKRGVPQGVSVSSILSDIYYQHMVKHMFSEYADNGLLCRYTDDIIYITKNEHYAKKFRETISNGIPEYNVIFNPSKIESNVGKPYRPTKIIFLNKSFKINKIQ